MSARMRVIDLTFGASITWPENCWYKPETVVEVIIQTTVLERREQGLPDQIQDPGVINRVANLMWSPRVA